MSKNEDLNQPEPAAKIEEAAITAEPVILGLSEPESEEHLFLNGSRIIASRTVLIPHGHVLAVKPFPRTKTGPTIEFQCASGGEFRSTRQDDHKTRTTRFIFHNWPDDSGSTPFILATYRGKKVMGMIHLQKVLAKSALWSLTYTFFYPIKVGPPGED